MRVSHVRTQASNFDADVLGDGVNSQGNRSKDGDSESAQSIALQKATRRLERGLSRDDPLAASLSASDQLRRKDKSPKKRFLSEKRGGPAHQTESVPDIIHDRAAGIRVPWNASDDDIEVCIISYRKAPSCECILWAQAVQNIREPTDAPCKIYYLSP